MTHENDARFQRLEHALSELQAQANSWSVRTDEVIVSLAAASTELKTLGKDVKATGSHLQSRADSISLVGRLRRRPRDPK